MRMTEALRQVAENVQEMKKDRIEEVEFIEEAEQVVTLPKGVGFYDTTNYPIGGKFDRVTDSNGLKVTVKRRFKSYKGTDTEGMTSDGKKVAFQMRLAKEEVDLDEEWIDVSEAVNMLEEGKSSTGYDLYHKDFSSAMQHAYDFAKKKYGITIDPEEIDSKVATGPKKPSEGKTNSYSLKGDKGIVQIQVYNKGGSKPYELNMYKS